jgi:hypothetical protein
VPIPAIGKTDPKILALRFLIDSASTLELDSQEGFSVHVLSQEVSPVPVIAKPNCGKSIVRENARDLLKVIAFLLTSVEFSRIDFLEL